MEANKVSEKYRALWEEAIRAASGPLSAYITPEGYGVSVMQVTTRPGRLDAFNTEVNARIDLGRTIKFGDLIGVLGAEMTSSYEHAIFHSEGIVRGKLHVPRLVGARARGQFSQIPSVLAKRQLATPENLLVSEMLQLSFRILRFWKSRGGAEGALAGKAFRELQAAESRYPWPELRAEPRPPLTTLAGIVKGRIKAGWNSPTGVISMIADLATRRSDPGLLDASAGPISYLGATDERFADKLFELLCIGWVHLALKQICGSVAVNPLGLRSAALPILTARKGDSQFRVFFQKRLGASARWRWVHSGRQLEGIPDLVLEYEHGGKRSIIVIDAKNRNTSSESEVAYKLLGYKENLSLAPYKAIAVFPEFENQFGFKHLKSSAEDDVILARIPLGLQVSKLGYLTLKIWRNLALR